MSEMFDVGSMISKLCDILHSFF